MSLILFSLRVWVELKWGNGSRPILKDPRRPPASHGRTPAVSAGAAAANASGRSLPPAYVQKRQNCKLHFNLWWKTLFLLVAFCVWATYGYDVISVIGINAAKNKLVKLYRCQLTAWYDGHKMCWSVKLLDIFDVMKRVMIPWLLQLNNPSLN